MPRVGRHRPGWCACVAIAAALSAGPVKAQEAAPPALTWSAPPECPQIAEFRRWLAGHLGTAADPAGYPGLTSQGALEREGQSWRLRLTIARAGTHGEKTLRGRDCVELARSGALALAIAIEPALAQGPASDPAAGVPEPRGEVPALSQGELPAGGPAVGVPAPPQSGVPAGDPVVPAPPQGGMPTGDPRVPGQGAVPASEPTAAQVPARALGMADGAGEGSGPGAIARDRVETREMVGSSRSLRRRVVVGHALRIAAGAEFGALPSVGAGVLGGYALRSPGLRVELTGSWWPGRRRAYAEPAEVGGTAQIGAVGLRVCPTPRVRAPRSGKGRAAPGLIELPLCAGVELGALVVRGFGFAGARTVRTLWAAAELQPGVVWRFTRRLALWSALALVVPITRASFAVDPLPGLFKVGAVGLRAAVGLEFHFGREPGEKN